MRFLYSLCWFLLTGCAITNTTLAADPAKWIWSAGTEPQIGLRKTIQLEAAPKEAKLAATCDNGFKLFINGEQVLAGNEWSRLETADVAKLLKPGVNVIAVEATDEGGLAGFLARLDVTDAAGKKQTTISDQNWRATAKPAGDWKGTAFDDASWKPVRVVGAVGAKNLPWSNSVDAEMLAVALGAQPDPIRAVAKPAENVTPRAGFKVEKLFDVPRTMGSWVALTTDDKGRLIASDQGGAGLYLIEPPAIGDVNAETKVAKLPVNFSGAHGLVWAFDSLYAIRAEGKSGLYRIKDANGDELLDNAEMLKPINGGGEHGPHAVIQSADGKSLLAIGGNHTALPEKYSSSSVPTNWAEDQLLPRRWDANGHATGILAPGGWICKVDESGKEWDVFSIGYRNQYDMAFNADGELFTYDSDMEWDLGSPWYKPTRVCHATDGSDFGWRSGTGNWPSYFDDTLPHVADIGPGSPVGVVFGYGAKFPAKYQKALYLLDWTYSTIYAVHLTPDGASYKGEVEDFVFGQPLQVTDAVVGKDGALYFTAGGRGTHSSLYRVIYTGDESTAPVDYHDERSAERRKLRHQLEAFHKPGAADLELIWANLGDSDRFIRTAARVALEFQPADQWKARALAETKARTALTALMALAHQGKPEDLDGVLTALQKIDPATLDEYNQLALLRVYSLAFTRLGKPTDAWREKILAKFDPLFPASTDRVTAELLQLLVYLESPTIVAKAVPYMENLSTQSEPIPAWSEIAKRNAGYGGTVQAMMNNMPPIRAIHFAFVLRNAKTGWTPELRKRYFALFNKAAMHPGGASFPGFLRQMRDDALATIPPTELALYDEILGAPLGAAPFKSTPAKGPGRKWTKDDALAALGSPVKGANFESGRNLFHASNCAKCHRFSGEGGAIGPDLSTAGRKFSLPDLMDAVLEPSKAVSDQYGSHQVVTSDGQSLLGRVVELGDELHIYTLDANAKPIVVKKADVEEMKVSPISQMPVGTVDALSDKELKDLVGYILSAGDRNAAVFKP